MPITAGEASSFCDMACSLSGCLWPAYRWLGREHGRTIPLRDLVESPPLRGNVADQGERDDRANCDLDRVRTSTGGNTCCHQIDPPEDLGGDQCQAERRTPLPQSQDENAA